MSSVLDAQNVGAAADNYTEKYWTVFSMEIKDVESKIANKEKVTSSFSCRSNPRPTMFSINLEFGRVESGWLSVAAKTTLSHVLLTKITSFLKDDCGNDLSTFTNTITDRLYKFIRPRVYEFLPSSKGSWRIIIEIEYKTVTPARSIPTEKIDRTRLQEDLLSLLEGSSNGDITFCFDDREIEAHKAILLARAPYFANMFQSGMKESSSKKVHITDVESGIFKAVLYYLYTGEAPKNMPEIALELLVAAEKYDLDELAVLCLISVCDHLTADNVVDALIVAEKISSSEVRERATLVLWKTIGALDQESAKKLKDRPHLAFDLAVQFSKM